MIKCIMKSSLKGHRFESGKYLKIDSGLSLSLPIEYYGGEDAIAEYEIQHKGSQV